MEGFSFADVVRVAGVSTATVSAWLKKDVFVADAAHAEGRGRHRRFSFANLIHARVVAELHAFGVPPLLLQRAVVMLGLAILKLDTTHPELADVFARVFDPTHRRPHDHVLLVVSEQLPGGFHLVVGDGPKPNLQISDYGSAFFVVNVRDAIEHVERATGDTYVAFERRVELQPAKDGR